MKTKRGCVYPSRLWAVGIFALWLPMAVNAAGTICPDFVDVQKSIKNLPKGWATTIKEQRIPLHHVGIFDGPMEEMASMIPDVDEDTYATWDVSTYKRGVWLGCFYDGAIIMLSKRLPDNLKECKVTYSPTLRVAPGARKILSIDCVPLSTRQQ